MAEGHLSTTRSAVVRGEPSGAAEDAVVLFLRRDGGTRQWAHCTGTLLAPRLVLTARHCVAETDPSSGCHIDGTPIGAGAIRANHDPKTMFVFTGDRRPDMSKELLPSGRGAAIVDDGAKNLCNHDIALVVLEEPVVGGAIAPIRLEGDVARDERLTSVGWGLTETGEPNVRQKREDVEVLVVGPGKGLAAGDVAPNEIQVGESICSGDSGSPALSPETGAVVGVASRGGNARGTASNPASKCVGSLNFYVKTSAFRDLLMRGFAAAGAEPWIEGTPNPYAPASAPPAPPTPHSAARPAAPEEGGCNIARADNGQSSMLVIALAALSIARRRRHASSGVLFHAPFRRAKTALSVVSIWKR